MLVNRYTLGGMSETAKLQTQLKRVKGQIGGIEKMLGEGRKCEELLTQLAAAMSSLKSVAREVLASEAMGCSTEEKGKDRYAMLLKRFF